MAAHQHVGAAAPGPVTPTESDDARELGSSSAGTTGNRTTDGLDSASAPRTAHALLVIEGEEYAHVYLARLQAGTASPGELAVILAFLADEMLYGACRVIEKALGVRHA